MKNRRFVPRPAPVFVVLLPLVTILWVYLFSLFGFDHQNLGSLRSDHPTLNDVQVIVMTDRLSVSDRVMLLYYDIPKAQPATGWRSTPITPDAALIAKGVDLVESIDVEHKERMLQLAQTGGGSFWVVSNERVFAWIGAIAGTLWLATLAVLMLTFGLHRRRARRHVARQRLGLCPECEYGFGGADIDRCPECGVRVDRSIRSARSVLRQRWFRSN